MRRRWRRCAVGTAVGLTPRAKIATASFARSTKGSPLTSTMARSGAGIGCSLDDGESWFRRGSRRSTQSRAPDLAPDITPKG